MIPVVYRSRQLLGVLLLTGISTAAGSDDPFTVLTDFQERLSGITTLHAAVRRRQTYREVSRDARGELWYAPTLGIRYEWKTPGHYLFVASDSLLFGIDLSKRCGWKSVPPDRRLRRQTDPLGRLLRLQSVPPEEFAYRGNNDSLLFFTVAGDHRTFRTIGIDPETRHCSIIERFAERQILLERTVFTYRKTRDTLPQTIVVTGPVGADLATDTITLVRPNRGTAIKKQVFTLPEGIDWGDNGPAGCLPQQQLHPDSGR